MSYTDNRRRHKSLMKKLKTGIWAGIGVTALICILVNVTSGSGAEKSSTVAVADTVEAEASETAEAVTEATTTTKKKSVDMKEMTEGRVVIKENILKDSPNYGYTGEMSVKGLMLHSIGVPITSAAQQASVFGEPNFWDAGVHGFIDSESGVVLHTLPWTQQAWHCGYEAGNGAYIGVEMCETDAGYYTDTYQFIVEDAEKAKEHCRTAYYSAVKLFAELCIRFNLDPLEDGVVISHEEGHARGIATNHGDPVNYWDAVDSGYTMDGFRQDVADYMKVIKDNGWELNENVLK